VLCVAGKQYARGQMDRTGDASELQKAINFFSGRTVALRNTGTEEIPVRPPLHI